MSLFAALGQKTPNPSTAAKFTTYCGILYMALGLTFLVWPGAIQTLLFESPFVGREEALFRIIGMVVLIIGWFYFIGGRTGSPAFIAATILDRLLLVPLVLIPTALAGVFPNVMFAFAVLDPTLASIAWYLLAQAKD